MGTGDAQITDGSESAITTNGTAFGNVNLGSTSTATFKVKNTGSASLGVSGLTSSDPKFVVSTITETVNAGDSTSFTVSYTPTSASTDQSTITLTNTDSDENPFTFIVNGTGVIPPGQIVLGSEEVAGSSLLPGRKDVLVYKMVWEVKTNAVTSSGFYLEFDGSFLPSDFESIELFISEGVDNLNSAESQGIGSFAPNISGAPETSYGWVLNRSFTEGEVIYVYLVADIESTALAGSSFNVRVPTDANFSFGDAVIQSTYGVGPTFNVVQANSAQDSLALVAFYNVTGGPESWVESSGWLTDDLSSWFGVTLNNGRVTSLLLPQNGLTGEVPSDIATLSELETIDISSNRVVSLPQLSTISTLRNLDVSGNNLQFGSLEPNVSINNFQYDNQGLIGEIQIEPTLIRRGGDFVLRLPVTGSKNKYSWSRVNANGEQVVSTEATVNISGISFENMGEFTLVITSDSITDLTLESHPQEVFATAILNGTVTGTGGTGLDAGTMDAIFIPFDGGRYDSLDQVAVTNGAFSFGELILGDYTCVTRGDSNIYLPSYFGNTDLWVESDTIFLRADLTIGDYEMQLLPEELPFLEGGAKIGLGVESDFAENRSSESARLLARRKLQKVGCSLRRSRRATGGRPTNEDFELIAYKETDANGEVTFENLPADTYRLNIEYPGIPMDPNSFIEFEVGEAGSDNNELTLAATVDEDGIAVELVEELGVYQPEFDNMRIYPNPATDQVTLSFDEVKEKDLVFIITNLEGKEIKQGALTIENKVSAIDLTGLKGGVFILQVAAANGTKRDAFRLIIRR